MHQIIHRLHHPPDILPHQLPRRLTKQNINLLQRLVLRLRHKQQLVHPPQRRDAAVEAEREPDARHGPLHVGEEVGHEPGAEEERHVRGLHAVGAEIGRVDLGGEHPGEAGVGAEEALVEDQARAVDARGGAEVVDGDEVRHGDYEEADEEAGEHGAGPVAPAEALHVEDGGDGAEEERAAADEGHEDALFGVEADLVHEGRHVVPDRPLFVNFPCSRNWANRGSDLHDGVDTRELA